MRYEPLDGLSRLVEERAGVDANAIPVADDCVDPEFCLIVVRCTWSGVLSASP
jgi:hypothetical protein